MRLRNHLYGEDSSRKQWKAWNSNSIAFSKIILQKVCVNDTPLILAREAAAAAKKEIIGSEKSRNTGGSSGRLTLQERLAASIAKSRTGSPKIATAGEEGSLAITSAPSTTDLSQIESNGVGKESGPPSPVRTRTPTVLLSPAREEPETSASKDAPSRTETPDIPVIPGDEPTSQVAISEPPIDTTKIETPSITPPEPAKAEAPQVPTSSARPSTSTPSDTDPAAADLISQLRSDLATCEARRIEEAQQATERITSLEQKLKILSQTTLETSKEVASNPDANAWERRLADREEKIALLLDEGTLAQSVADVGEKLAKIELNLMTTIKSLRAKQKEDERATNAALSRAERADKQVTDLKAQLKKANEIEKKNTERLKGMYKIEAANEALRREKEAAQVPS